MLRAYISSISSRDSVFPGHDLMSVYAFHMEDFWLKEAVLNNVAWCNAVAASHRLSTTQNESVWLSEHPMPPLYPNIISLKARALINDYIDTISPQLPSGWGIKDSYGDLELEGEGFAVAFEAQWYCRLPNQGTAAVIKSDSLVNTVQPINELDQWIATWGEGDGILNSTLLENKAIKLVCVERDGRVVSGLAMNQSGDSIGISNLFGPFEDIACCIASIVRSYPMKGIVGYGSKAELVALSKIGFNEIGNLRVSLRD